MDEGIIWEMQPLRLAIGEREEEKGERESSKEVL